MQNSHWQLQTCPTETIPYCHEALQLSYRNHTLLPQSTAIKNEINKLLDAQVILSSPSSWSAPIIIVPKDDVGKCHVINYRTPNKVIQMFVLPIPKVKDISKLNSVQYFLTLDLQAGYHHIPISDASIPKTAFTLPFGKYKYLTILFRLA